MTRAGFLILHPEPGAPAMLAPMLRALGHEPIESASYRAVGDVPPERPGVVVLGVDPIEPRQQQQLAALRRGRHAMPLIVIYTAERPRSIGRMLDHAAIAVLPFPLQAIQLHAAVTQALESTGAGAPGAVAAPVNGRMDCRARCDEVPCSRLEPIPAHAARAASHVEPASSATVVAGALLRPLKEALEAPERTLLIEALLAFAWNRNETADALEISRSTLYHKMKKHHLFDLEPV